MALGLVELRCFGARLINGLLDDFLEDFSAVIVLLAKLEPLLVSLSIEWSNIGTALVPLRLHWSS